jgi:hypothetical protein
MLYSKGFLPVPPRLRQVGRRIFPTRSPSCGFFLKAFRRRLQEHRTCKIPKDKSRSNPLHPSCKSLKARDYTICFWGGGRGVPHMTEPYLSLTQTLQLQLQARPRVAKASDGCTATTNNPHAASASRINIHVQERKSITNKRRVGINNW